MPGQLRSIETSVRKGCHSLEGLRLGAPIQKIRICANGPANVRMRFPDHHQPIRFGKWQCAQQDSIDDTEDSCICADPQSERKHSYRGEASMLKYYSRAETQILKHLILHSSRLQSERIHKGTQTVPQQIEFVATV